jgi:hypothetical protein
VAETKARESSHRTKIVAKIISRALIWCFGSLIFQRARWMIKAITYRTTVVTKTCISRAVKKWSCRPAGRKPE